MFTKVLLGAAYLLNLSYGSVRHIKTFVRASYKLNTFTSKTSNSSTLIGCNTGLF